jgi:hypothetical protein
MKKIVVLLSAFALVGAFAFAQEEDAGIGLTVLMNFGIDDLGDVDERTPVIAPELEYENAFLEGALDVYGDLAYTVSIGEDETVQSFDLEVELGYNLSLSGVSILSIILNEQNSFQTSPEVEDTETETPFSGIFESALKFNQGFGFGDIFAKVGLPIVYAYGEKDGDPFTNIYLTLGYSGGVGPGTFGLELTPFSYNIDPVNELGFGKGAEAGLFAHDADLSTFGLLLSYELADTFYAEVDIKAYDPEFKVFAITPEFNYFLNRFTFKISAEFLKVDGVDDVYVSPSIAVGYSF